MPPGVIRCCWRPAPLLLLSFLPLLLLLLLPPPAPPPPAPPAPAPAAAPAAAPAPAHVAQVAAANRSGGSMMNLRKIHFSTKHSPENPRHIGHHLLAPCPALPLEPTSAFCTQVKPPTSLLFASQHQHLHAADGTLESHALHSGDNILGRQPLSDNEAGTGITIRSQAVSRRHLCVTVR